MPRLCERPGCSSPAEVAYGFDAESLVVWLDAYDAGQGTRSGGLCRRHADAMVVPLGWMLDDRREPAPRLFTAARMHDLTDELVRPRQRRSRADRSDRTLELLRTAAMQLSLEDMGAGGSPDGEIREAGPAPIALVTDPTVAMLRPVVEPESEAEPEPEAAIEVETEAEAAIEVDAEVDTEAEAEVAVEPAAEEHAEPEASRAAEIGVPDAEADAEAEADEQDQESGQEQDAQVLPWQPRFDQQDDLSGLLQARGRLLSRAFRGITADGA